MRSCRGSDIGSIKEFSVPGTPRNDFLGTEFGIGRYDGTWYGILGRVVIQSHAHMECWVGRVG